MNLENHLEAIGNIKNIEVGNQASVDKSFINNITINKPLILEKDFTKILNENHDIETPDELNHSYIKVLTKG